MLRTASLAVLAGAFVSSAALAQDYATPPAGTAAPATAYDAAAPATTASADTATGGPIGWENGTRNGTFRGFRAEVNVGADRFQSEGDHDDAFGFGATAGFDGTIGERIVVGPEVSYWRSRGENTTPGGLGGYVTRKSFNEINAAVRAGYLVTPSILVFAKGGYAVSEQRKAYTLGTGQQQFYNRFSTTGYMVGGGAELALTDRFYVNAEYRYTNYETHAARQRASIGAGIRF